MPDKKLRKEIVKGLNALALNDRDLRTIAIWCNPNNIWHTKALGGYPNKEILKELKTMENEGLIYQQKKIIATGYNNNLKTYKLWSLT